MWPNGRAGQAFEDAIVIANDFLEYWDKDIKAGAQVREFHLSKDSALKVIRALPMYSKPKESKRIPLLIQLELVRYGQGLDTTSAGRKVEGDIDMMIDRLERFLAADREMLARLKGKGSEDDEEVMLANDRVIDGEAALSRLRGALNYLKEAWEKFVNAVRHVRDFVLSSISQGSFGSYSIHFRLIDNSL